MPVCGDFDYFGRLFYFILKMCVCVCARKLVEVCWCSSIGLVRGKRGEERKKGGKKMQVCGKVGLVRMICISMHNMYCMYVRTQRNELGGGILSY